MYKLSPAPAVTAASTLAVMAAVAAASVVVETEDLLAENPVEEHVATILRVIVFRVVGVVSPAAPTTNDAVPTDNADQRACPSLPAGAVMVILPFVVPNVLVPDDDKD